MDKRLLFSAVLAAMISANEAKASYPTAIPAQVVARAESGATTSAEDDYVKGYQAVKEKYTYDASAMINDLSKWEGNMITNKGQHWSGDGSRTYWEQTGSMWSQNSWSVYKKTNVSLPKGKYALVVAARTSASVNGFLRVDNDTVTLANKGDNGLGIDTQGNASYDPDGTYANDNKGRGWEWRTVEFEVTTDEPVTIEFGGTAKVKQQWMSVCDISLLAGADVQKAYASQYKDILNTYKYDASAYLGDVNAWSGTFETNHGEHWSDDARNYFDHWEDRAWSRSKKTTIENLPAGKYVLIASGRGTTQTYIKVNDKAAYFISKGNEGKGIDKNGDATFEESATYANDNKGRGWEWRTVEFEVANDNDPVTLEIGAAGNANTWASICDISLKTTVNRDYETSLAELTDAIAAARAAVPTANVGDAAFLIPQSAVNALNEAIANANKTKDNADATAETLKAETGNLNKAVEAVNNVELNKPQEGEKFNIVINGNNGYKFDGKTLTFKPGNTNQGGYAMGYTEDAGSFYNQTMTMIPVEGQTNEYYLAIEQADGDTVYVGTGVNYGGNAQQLRATTDKSKALAVKIEVTTNEGLYHLRNTANDGLISANNAADNGFFTANKQWNNFNLVPAKKNSASLNVTDAKWATFIAPFDVEIPAGVKAYTCDKVENTVLTLNEATEMKANTPYILYAESPVEKTVEGYASGQQAAYTAGLLTGVYVTNESLPANARNYVLQKQGDDVAFFKVDKENVRCVANRAYITVPEEASQAKAFSLIINGGTTSINGITGNGLTEVERYNANGVKVDAPVKGLNIVKMSDGTIVKQIIK